MSIARCVAMAVVVWGLAASRAEACSCAYGPGPACQAAFADDAVFLGVVRSVAPDPTGLRVTIDLRERFRGDVPPTVSVLTGRGGGDCGFPFVEGEPYLVYGQRVSSSGELRTGICSATKAASDAAGDLAFLRTLDHPAPAGARAFGQVKHIEPSIGGGQATTYPPLEGLAIALRDGARTFNTRTDSQGRYEFSPLPPGRYEMSVRPPAGMTMSGAQRPIDVPDVRACFEHDLYVHYDGRVSGTVARQSGHPLPEGTTVELLERDPPPQDQNAIGSRSRRTAPDAEGRYEFTDVPPGRYVVGVDVTRVFGPRVVFPSTFHPGTGDIFLATVIDLAGGERRTLAAFVLPEPRPRVPFTGTVRMPDGQAVSGARVAIGAGDGSGRSAVPSLTTDDNGRFETTLHGGLAYIIQVFHGDGSGIRATRQFRARVGIVMPTAPPGNFDITLAPIGSVATPGR